MKNITFKNKLGYFFGDVGNTMTFAMSMGFLLKFYTDVAGITAAAAGTLFFVARIWDAFTDPMMGILCDKLFGRRMQKNQGKKVDKFKPFLVSGSFLVVLAAILMFFMPSGLTSGQKLVWAYVTYILWGMCYTYINIPYGSLSSVMTQDPVERASLSVARGLGSNLANMIPRVVVPFILTAFAEEQAKGYLVSMVILGIVAIISYFITYFTVEENIQAPVQEKKAEKGSLLQSIKVMGKNRPFIAVCAASLGLLFGMMMNSAMMAYYFSENLGNVGAMGIATVMSILPTIIIAPFLSKLVRKYTVKTVVSVASLLAAISFIIVFFLPSTLLVYVIGMGIGQLFMSVPMTLVYGMVADSIDYNQYISGERQEGAIYGSYSFVRKMGQAIAGLVSGAGLTLVGYEAGVAQTESALVGIKFLAIGVPAVGLFIAYICFRTIWNITPERQAEIYAAINE